MFSFLNFIILLAESQEKKKKKYKGVDILSNNVKSVEEIAREERLAYFREWRANNKDKVKKHNATYWQKRAERIIAEREANKDE